jgi:hypothetical protein
MLAIYGIQNIHCFLHMCPPLVGILTQMNLLHALAPPFLRILFIETCSVEPNVSLLNG